LERAKAELGHGIEIVERLHTAQKKRGKLRVFVQRFGQIAPLYGESIHRRLAAFPGLLTKLDREINDRRNSDKDRSELTDGCEHCPVHLKVFAFE
jgi:hypothetical protein